MVFYMHGTGVDFLALSGGMAWSLSFALFISQVGRNDLGMQRYDEHMNDRQAIPDVCAAVLRYTHFRTKASARGW